MADDQRLAGLRALVIEDEYFVADDLKHILKRHGADHFKLSGSIEDAIRRVRENGFELALLDINIHGEMAFRLADEFKRRQVSFGFVSGYERSAIPDRFASTPLLTKPYSAAELVSYVQRLRAGSSKTF